MTDDRYHWLGRSDWCALPKSTRREVIKLARKGQPHPDRKVAAKALGWAWAVLGPPGSRRSPTVGQRLGFAFEVVTTTSGSNVGVDILDGSARYDHYPWVRHIARQIEKANANVG